MSWRELLLRLRVWGFRWAPRLCALAGLVVAALALWRAHAAAPRWPAVAGWLVAGVLVGAAGVWFAGVLARVMPDFYRYSRNVLDQFLAYRDRRGFFLYLRPFREETFTVDRDEVVAPGNDGRTTHGYYVNLSQLLALALEPWGRVLFIGREPADPFGDYGLVLETDDASWRGVFRSCAADARAVLIAPGDSPSVAEELGVLLGGDLAPRVVVVMRPADADGGRARRWADIGRRLAAGGVALPEYDPRGALVVLRGDEWMYLAFSDRAPEAQAIRGCFAYLDRTFPGRFGGRVPLRDALPTLPLLTRLSGDDAAVVRPAAR